MSNREFTATRTMLANAMATAGAELLEYMGTAGALAAIPNTDPPRYAVAGTLQIIAKLLPAIEPAPAAHAQAELTEERIAELAASFGIEPDDRSLFGSGDVESFARAIASEVRLSAVREARNEAQWISVDDERKPTIGTPVLVYVRTLTNGEDDDGRPYEEEGAVIDMGEYKKASYDGEYYFSCFMSPISDNDWITHWMPMPAPPVVSPAASKEGDA
jgi:hypothetical protein